MKSMKLSLVVLTAGLFITACGGNETSTSSSDAGSGVGANASAPTDKIEELASARTVYKQNCAKCHKEDGTGGPTEVNGRTIRVPDFTSESVKRLPDEAYLRYIRNGDEEEGMPAFKDRLSPEEMVGLVKLIRAEFQSEKN